MIPFILAAVGGYLIGQSRNSGQFAEGGDVGSGWEKQKEWHGNPSLGYDSYRKYFSLPSGRKVPVYVYGKEGGWSFVVSAGASSDYSYTGGFPEDVRNGSAEVAMSYVDSLNDKEKLIK